jgi:hypothetical protein
MCVRSRIVVLPRVVVAEAAGIAAVLVRRRSYDVGVCAMVGERHAKAARNCRDTLDGHSDEQRERN